MQRTAADRMNLFRASSQVSAILAQGDDDWIYFVFFVSSFFIASFTFPNEIAIPLIPSSPNYIPLISQKSN